MFTSVRSLFLALAIPTGLRLIFGEAQRRGKKKKGTWKFLMRFISTVVSLHYLKGQVQWIRSLYWQILESISYW